jgi:hypothetical protein
VKRLWVNLRRWARKLLGLSDPPERIALGAALGMAVAFGPTYGLQVVLAIGLAALLRCNKVAALLPTFLVNPVTGPPTFVLQYLLGRAVLGGGSEAERQNAHRLAEALGGIQLHQLKATVGAALAAARDMGWGVLWPALVGMGLSATVLAALTYPVVYRGVIWFRRARAARRPGSATLDPAGRSGSPGASGAATLREAAGEKAEAKR